MSPLSDNIIAIGFVLGNCDKIIIITTDIGTLKNIPVIPQIEPHIDNAINVARELMLSVFPINFGSNILPIITCIVPTRISTNKNG